MEQAILQIRMLGGFSLTLGSEILDENDNRAHKLWTLLQYLITFRHRDIPRDELSALLWPDRPGGDHDNVLKALIHRARRLLDGLGLDGGAVVTARRGVCRWNSDAVPCRVDAEDMEQHLHYGERTRDPEERLERLLAAAELYRGEFLPGAGRADWVQSRREHFREAYLQAVRTAAELLRDRARIGELTDLLRKAVALEPYEEDLHAVLIRVLAQSGCHAEAREHYERTTTRFYEEFGVTPSREFTALYRDAVRIDHSTELDLTAIKEELREKERLPGAYFCEYEVFKDIYRLEARALLRQGQAIYLALVTLTGPGGGPLGAAAAEAMEGLHEAIRLSLRQGDVFTRYSLSQYLVMLPGASLENSRAVTERILARYRRDNPRSAAEPRCRLQSLDPVQNAGE